MPLDFPSNPTNGQVYDTYVYDSSIASWRSLGSTNNLATQATALDARMGLNLITSQSFSGSASVAINNVFTSAYENYRVVVSNLTNTNPGINQIFMRMRSNGVDAAGATDYRTAYMRYYSAGTANGASNGQPNMGLGYFSTGGDCSITFDIFRPAVADLTLMTFDAWSYQSDIGTYIYATGGNMHKLSNAYDGFMISGEAGTIAGDIRVYGYKN